MMIGNSFHSIFIIILYGNLTTHNIRRNKTW